jgi:hypothetical protein
VLSLATSAGELCLALEAAHSVVVGEQAAVEDLERERKSAPKVHRKLFARARSSHPTQIGREAIMTDRERCFTALAVPSRAGAMSPRCG